MENKGTVGKVRGLIGRLKKTPAPEDALLEAGAHIDTAGEASSPTAEEVSQENTTKIDLLLEGFDRHGHQIEDLVEELRRLCGVNERLIEAVRSAQASGAPSREPATELTEHREELSSELHRLAVIAERQMEVLEDIRSELGIGRKGDPETANAISRLSESLEDLNRSDSARVELLERIHERLVGTNEKLSEMIASHGRRLSWLLLGVIAMLGVVAILVGIVAR